MPLSYSIFLFLILLSWPASAAVEEKLSLEHSTWNIFIQGHNQKLPHEDGEALARQIVKVFNSCAISTEQGWLHDQWTKDGQSIQDRWSSIKSHDHFSISYGDQGSLNVREAIIAIPKERGIGHVMAELKSGEIRGYIKCMGMDMVHLYCMNEVRKYLPDAHQNGTSGYNCDAVMQDDIDRQTKNKDS